MTSEPGAPENRKEANEVDSLEYAVKKVSGWGEARALARRLGPAGPLAVVSAICPAIGGFILVYYAQSLSDWLVAQEGTGVAVYIVGFALLAGLALLPTYAQAFLAGWAFKMATGTGAALAGIAGAATIGYLVARRASGDRVVTIIEEQLKWKVVYNALIRSGEAKALLIVTLIRIPPNSPFAITNLVLAACKVRPVTYIVGTVLGIAPRTALAVMLGSRAEALDLSQSANRWYLIGGIVAFLIVVGIIGSIANRALARVTAETLSGNNGVKLQTRDTPGE